jgi:hypothetical protein
MKVADLRGEKKTLGELLGEMMTDEELYYGAMKLEPIVTKDVLKDMLDVDKYGIDYVQKVVGSALYSLLDVENPRSKVGAYARSVGPSNPLASVGFTPSDRRKGSITAKYYRKHGTLTPSDPHTGKKETWRVNVWIEHKTKDPNSYPRLCYYTYQLNVIANIKKVFWKQREQNQRTPN